MRGAGSDQEHNPSAHECPQCSCAVRTSPRARPSRPPGTPGAPPDRARGAVVVCRGHHLSSQKVICLKRHGFLKETVRDFKEEFGELFPVQLVSIPPRFAVTTNKTVEDRPILTTFRYKQVNIFNSAFQIMRHEILLEILRCTVQVSGGTQRGSPRARRPPTRSRRGKMLAIDSGRRRARFFRRCSSWDQFARLIPDSRV